MEKTTLPTQTHKMSTKAHILYKTDTQTQIYHETNKIDEWDGNRGFAVVMIIDNSDYNGISIDDMKLRINYIQGFEAINIPISLFEVRDLEIDREDLVIELYGGSPSAVQLEDICRSSLNPFKP